MTFQENMSLIEGASGMSMKRVFTKKVKRRRASFDFGSASSGWHAKSPWIFVRTSLKVWFLHTLSSWSDAYASSYKNPFSMLSKKVIRSTRSRLSLSCSAFLRSPLIACAIARNLSRTWSRRASATTTTAVDFSGSDPFSALLWRDDPLRDDALIGLQIPLTTGLLISWRTTNFASGPFLWCGPFNPFL